MNEVDVKAIAEAMVRGQELKGCSVSFVEARRRPRHPHEWAAVFEIISEKGNIVDGPIVVFVDEATKIARLSESP